ncbi:hypothetical protein GCM10010363_07870 [Streptomyces omiyaensis]|uniref:hypothetical protein n=1 Tax=Streptomyces omiyaensis TaxID=68247 RepID=UPI001679A004|nr:hypothetical protein [Streptomyces omiyaensis]GGY29819.1 hypothetical protein GCM10010363_07870 [Streptomyces omiyaensis]
MTNQPTRPAMTMREIRLALGHNVEPVTARQTGQQPDTCTCGHPQTRHNTACAHCPCIGYAQTWPPQTGQQPDPAPIEPGQVYRPTEGNAARLPEGRATVTNVWPGTETERSIAVDIATVDQGLPATVHSLMLESQLRRWYVLDIPATAAGLDASQPATDQTQPPRVAWRIEHYDPQAKEWVPQARYTTHEEIVDRIATLNARFPLWADKQPVKRRIVRETTTWTVEGTDQ